MKEYSDSPKYAAEFFGTLALVLVGCGSAVIAGPGIGLTGISFAFGLTVLVMVYAIGPISGCHINPAISVAMLLAGKLEGRLALGYIVSQIIGAIAGAGILYLIASGEDGWTIDKGGLGQNGFDELTGYNMTAAMITEAVFTFLFLFVIFGATSKKAPAGFAGIAIGFALVLIHLVTIPVTGTSVNPARSLGPAVFVGGEALEQVWLFIVFPIIGAAIAAFVWKGLFEPND